MTKAKKKRSSGQTFVSKQNEEETISIIENLPTNSASSDLEKNVSQLVDTKLADLKKMMIKMYTLQKRTSDPNQVITLNECPSVLAFNCL